jgi:DNA repair protein RadC
MRLKAERRRDENSLLRFLYGEKLTQLAERGPEALSDSDLTMLITRTEPPRRLATDDAPLSVAEMQAEYGARAGILLAASLEFGRRTMRGTGARPDFSAPEAVHKWLAPRLVHLQKERFIALALDSKNRLMREITVSEGDLNSSIVHPREVFRPLIAMSAGAVIFVHNHPSGDPTPSQRDVDVTQRLRQVGDLLGIKVLDHVIVATAGFYSFQSHGFLARPQY